MEDLMEELKSISKHFANVLKYNPELLTSKDLAIVIEVNFLPLISKAYEKQKDILVNDLTHLDIKGNLNEAN